MQTEKNGFFKEVKKSIKDFDQYEDFAIATTGKSMQYILILILILALVIYGLFIYKFSVSDEEGLSFFKENILNLNFEEEGITIEEIDNIIIQSKNDVIIPIWIYLLYLTNGIVDAVILAALGYIVARISRIKILFKASFRMAIHALTLPILLEILYIIVHSLTGFEIRYFDWMYTTISYIYMIVAILMIKTDIINRQLQLIKLQEEQKKVREKIKKEKESEPEKEEKPDEKKENKEEKKKDSDNNLEGEVGTSQA